jgi:hypothetical protein
MKRDAFPSRVGSVLERVFKNLGIDKKMRELKALSQWREVVGEKINLHTRPLAIRKRNLFVLVDNSSWLAQLSYIKHKIISEFDRRYGEGVVENIYFRLGEVKKAKSGKTPALIKERKTRLPKREVQKIEGILKMVKDTSLSRVLRRILIKERGSSKGREEIPHHSPE